MSAATTEANRIAGAKRCIEVLRQAMRSMEKARRQSTPEPFGTKDAAYTEMMAVAGPLSRRRPAFLARWWISRSMVSRTGTACGSSCIPIGNQKRP